jgi:hypothetical protein
VSEAELLASLTEHWPTGGKATAILTPPGPGYRGRFRRTAAMLSSLRARGLVTAERSRSLTHWRLTPAGREAVR